MSPSDAEVLLRAWEAFARRDVAAIAGFVHPDVRWYPAGEPEAEGACHNREEAIAFIDRALAEGLTGELLDVRDAGDRLVAVVHTHAPPEWERGPEPHGELVTVRDGKVTEMVVYASVEDALMAAGLGPGD
jgi:ketosteroid isomerase-like protein